MFAFIILGCNQNLKKDDLMGTWDVVSETDIETGKVRFPESDELFFVEFKSDSLYLSPDLSASADNVAWRIEGDSIFINDDEDAVYITELTDNELTVEYGFLSKRKYLVKLKKRK